MSRKVLTPAAAMEIKRLYSLMDNKGNHVHSQMEIADMLGVGETTVYRAIHRRGGYAEVRELPTDEEAAASKARFLAAHPELVQAEDKMAAAIAAERERAGAADRMVNELVREGEQHDAGYE